MIDGCSDLEPVYDTKLEKFHDQNYTFLVRGIMKHELQQLRFLSGLGKNISLMPFIHFVVCVDQARINHKKNKRSVKNGTFDQ